MHNIPPKNIKRPSLDCRNNIQQKYSFSIFFVNKLKIIKFFMSIINNNSIQKTNLTDSSIETIRLSGSKSLTEVAVKTSTNAANNPPYNVPLSLTCSSATVN